MIKLNTMNASLYLIKFLYTQLAKPENHAIRPALETAVKDAMGFFLVLASVVQKDIANRIKSSQIRDPAQ